MKSRTAILVVDDEEIVRLSHLRILASIPCSVKAVRDGEQALREMEVQPYDLVLLDLRMPGMDGITLLKALKARWPESEVIVITGYACVETAKEAIRWGAYDYLTKPLAPDEVINATSSALQQKHWTLRCANQANSTRGAQALTTSAAH